MGSKITVTKILNTFKEKLTWGYAKSIILSPSYILFPACLIVFAELLLNIIIVEHVPYTEIDWKAYMQECEGFLNGTYDYSQLRGETGPLVYPAGFVYLYSILYYITSQGENVKLAQNIFIGIYLLQLILVFRIYIKTRKVPPYVLAITVLTSYRIHSIYVLRLFNDPIAVLFLYVSLNLFLDSHWYLASIFYSLGVSIKMNVLLYAPALFLYYLINLGLKGTLYQISVCGLIQLILGLPFLVTYPISYIKGSFDLGRVFNHTWTVNYRFLDKQMFESKCFHLTLLGIHIMLLIIFMPMCVKYFKSYCRLRYVQKQAQTQIDFKNFENKRKHKVSKEARKKLLKNNHGDEKLSKEQEAFLQSFEKMLQKSGNKNAANEVKSENKSDDLQHYSVNFNVVSQLFILPMFITNFIGVACARSLHYQFYCWYFHSLPYLLWSTNYSTIFRFLILALIEFSWNTYPSTNLSSALLHFCHGAIIYGVYSKTTAELNIVSKVQ